MQGARTLDNTPFRLAAPAPVSADPHLVRQARAGDRAARDRLLGHLADVWYRYCLAILRDPEAARDAAQESALRFLTRLDQYRGQARIETFAIGFAVNVCREHKRQKKHDTTHHEDPHAPETHQPDSRAQRREDQQRIAALIAALPERQREAVVLRYYEHLPLAEVAETMGCAVGTVKATLSQALRSLRRQWSPS